MNNEELKEWANEQLDPEMIVVHDITGVNHTPHIYMIGQTHLTRNNSMYLGDVQIREMEREHGPMCYQKVKGRRCTVPYGQHTSDKVAFIKLQRDLKNQEAADQLMLLKEKFTEEGVDGFGFLETGYRIAPPKKAAITDAT